VLPSLTSDQRQTRQAALAPFVDSVTCFVWPGKMCISFPGF
jgi:hypothetical protein